MVNKNEHACMHLKINNYTKNCLFNKPEKCEWPIHEINDLFLIFQLQNMQLSHTVNDNKLLIKKFCIAACT